MMCMMAGGLGGIGGRSSDECQDSSPKTHPKGFKPPTPEVLQSHVCMWGSLVPQSLGVRLESERL